MSGLAQHSRASVEWGTPDWLLDMGRRVLGGPYDLDPCSSALFNQKVRATRFFDTEQDGLQIDAWQVKHGTRILCNPPGGLVRQFFQRCAAAYYLGANVFWIGFSLEQLTYLQADGACHCTAWTRCILPKRVAFLRDGEPTRQPTHGNYLLLMAHEKAQHRRFMAEAREIGAEAW